MGRPMRQPKLGRTIVWTLRTHRSQANCVIQPQNNRVELLVLHEHAIAVRDTFADPISARLRAENLKQGLVAKGWREVSR